MVVRHVRLSSAMITKLTIILIDSCPSRIISIFECSTVCFKLIREDLCIFGEQDDEHPIVVLICILQHGSQNKLEIGHKKI
jgi:hypothetical protein